MNLFAGHCSGDYVLVERCPSLPYRVAIYTARSSHWSVAFKWSKYMLASVHKRITVHYRRATLHSEKLRSC